MGPERPRYATGDVGPFTIISVGNLRSLYFVGYMWNYVHNFLNNCVWIAVKPRNFFRYIQTEDFFDKARIKTSSVCAKRGL